ncbi:hypothetical protein FEK30_00230 (plasmid) [Picosynechococcus sp. PCC 11901]|uniref:hypothetical protein n=1 Tax=Picosynechococcus sp. PCC 11901 TaxID=2579791 RepID=UPI0010FBC1CA|nr:hypothetical protein [Picosynechococcus sp. PCC 11901]QCS47993.1 hypothetical protein FEK30_00230 [Picosynechococcus sp. PCC 11901]
MSRERLRHSFYSSNNSPLRQIIEDLKNIPGCTLQKELEDILLISRYPYVLQRLGASPDQIAMQAQESIRRLEQDISALRTLLATYGTSSNAVRFQPDAVIQEDSLNIFDIQDNF